MSTQFFSVWLQALFGTWIFCFCTIAIPLATADTNDVITQLRRLEEQNRGLQDQLGQQATVPEKGSVKADFVLGIKGLPQY